MAGIGKKPVGGILEAPVANDNMSSKVDLNVDL